jgi:hypothetical protein
MPVFAKGYNYVLAIGTDTTLPLEAPASDTFTTVGNLSTITPPSWTQEAETYYEHSSSAPKSIGGRLNQQTVTGTLNKNRTDAGQILMQADKGVVGGQLRNYRLTHPDGLVQNFVGWLGAYEEQEAPAGQQGPKQISFTINVTGTVTEA